jgi:methylated-DNA-[protein]-cysteine S-methyltransferase
VTLDRCAVDSPLGPLVLAARGEALVGLHLPGSAAPAPAGTPRATPVLARAAAQLAEYFGGSRRAFDLPLAADGTPFQQAVWAALRTIPFGATWSYGALARRIGQPAASRAVGAANRRNPIAIIIPCHRVIGADGSLTGFGGGLTAKRFLLAHEREADAPSLPLMR